MPDSGKKISQQTSESDRKIAEELRYDEHATAAVLLRQDQVSANTLLVQNQKIAVKLLVRNQQDAIRLLGRNQKTAAALLRGKSNSLASRSKTAAKLLGDQQQAIIALRQLQKKAAARLIGHQQKAILALRQRQEKAVKVLVRQQRKAAELLKQIQVIVESSHDAIIGTTLGGIITSWNRGAEKMFGYASEEVVGQSGSMLFPREIWDQVPALLKKIQKQEEVADYDIMGMRKDGTRFDLAISISPITGDDGTVIGASVVERDITERKKAEGQLLLSKDLIDRSSDSIEIVDLKTLRYVDVNRTCVANLGYTKQELLTMTVFDTNPFLTTPMVDGLRATMEAGKSAIFETTQRRKDGTTFPAEVSMTAVVKDQTSYVVAVVRDVTERKKYESRLKESDMLKNKFIHIVSHQFRTPLSAIRWNLEALMGDNLGTLKTEQKEFIRLTHDADVEVLNRMGDLLTVMDIEEGRIRIDKSNVSLENLLVSVLGTYKPRCDVRGLVCEYFPSKESVPLVEADPEKIRSVLEKLVLNAINYTPAKGNITVSLVKKGAMARFEITDTGVGIPKAEQSRIFTWFYRASNAAAMMPDASGLGLYLAKYVIDQHGGKLGFTSQEGKGSTFWFELPLKNEGSNATR